MKLIIAANKIGLLALLVGIIFTGLTLAQDSQEPVYKVELTAEGWNVVLEVINSSSAPHNQVVLVQQTLISQLQTQITSDSTAVPVPNPQ